jgi:hypothetical protein
MYQLKISNYLKEKIMDNLDGKLVRFIEQNINKGNYVQKNIQVAEATGDNYFYFGLVNNNQGYAIFAKPNIELPKDIELPSSHANSSVIWIGTNAFSSSLNRVILNQKIESVIIPESITNILDEAFKECINLKTVTIYGGRVPTLGNDVFKNTNKDLVIYVPEEMVAEYKNDPSWSVYKDKILGKDIPSDDEIPDQNGIVNTVVTTIADSKEVSIAYNFYFLNINNSSVNNSDDDNDSDEDV